MYVGFELIKKAYEKQAEEKIWQMWVSIYPNMDKEHFISFKDFKDSMTEKTSTPKQKLKTKEEIYAQADKIVAAYNKSKGGKI